jgi:hypothetical protein
MLCSLASGCNAQSVSCLASCRYGTYKLVQKQPGGEKLVAFTRILHRQKGDVLMDEVGVSSRYASSLEDFVVAGRLWEDTGS